MLLSGSNSTYQKPLFLKHIKDTIHSCIHLFFIEEYKIENYTVKEFKVTWKKKFLQKEKIPAFTVFSVSKK